MTWRPASPYEAWLDEGQRNGWVQYACLQHDWLYTDDEAARLDEGDDPCMPRLIVTPPAQAALDIDTRQQTLFEIEPKA